MAETVFNCIEEATDTLYHDSMKALKRYDDITSYFARYKTSDQKQYAFSASGRIEICGNHTDHQGGKVLTAAIENDAVAIASRNTDNVIRIHTKGQKSITVNLESVDMREKEQGKSSGMVRGIAAAFISRGVSVCGVDMCIASDVATGSGISSSAAFETLVATILNYICNDNRFSQTEIAKICQFSESVYFGKPCGLMDQMASACGGCIAIDFSKCEPCITSVDMKCVIRSHEICLIHAGGNHTKLGREYAAIVNEMCAVASIFGKEKLSMIEEDEFISRLAEVRSDAGDRAALRAMHYYAENKRVVKAITALAESNTEAFLDIINDSGDSSTLLLQNVYVEHIENKSIALALALTKKFFFDNECKGACRIHGGGFLGTILTFVPKENANKYKEYMRGVFGENSVDTVRIREYGGIAVAPISEHKTQS